MDGPNSEAIIQKTKTTYAALQSYSDTGTVAVQAGSFSFTTHFKTRLQRRDFYLIEWQREKQALMPNEEKGVVWSDSTGDFLDFAGQGPKKQTSREMAMAGATGISSGAAATIPAEFFGDSWGNKLSRQQQREPDEKLAGIDCYVVTSSIKAKEKTFSTTLWIGKQDDLIHQIKTVTTGMSELPPIEDDATLKKMLGSQNKPVTPEAIADLRKSFTAAQAMAQSMLKSGVIQNIETHSDIVTDKTFAPADFKPATK